MLQATTRQRTRRLTSAADATTLHGMAIDFTLPPDVEARLGPISTGLGEIHMWSVHYKPRERASVGDGKQGWQSDGSYLTPDGQRLTTEIERGAYLRTVQDWIIRPQVKTVPGVAGADGIGLLRNGVIDEAS